MTSMSHYRILTLNAIAPQGLHRFPADRYTVGKAVEHPDAIIVRSHDMHAMEIPASVKAIGRAGAGTNNIPVAGMSKRGAPVFNAPGANANAVKELVLTAMLMAARNIVPALRYVAALDPADRELEARVEEGKQRFAGIELPDRTLGIIGLGAIGSLVADTAIKLGMKVIGFDPEITVDAAWRLPSSVRKANSIEEVLRHSDFVSLHVPLLPVTQHLIDEKRLAVAKAGAVLLNFARDAIVDEAAVHSALRSGQLKYYFCDFPSGALLTEPNVVALPHLGASTAEAEENCAAMVVDQVREYLEHGTIGNAVNFPNVEMPRESPHRVAIANANVPNMLGQISSTMANAGLNIHNMVNKSRGEMAYTLVDVDSPVDDAVVRSIAAIHGVLSVRAIPVEPPQGAMSVAGPSQGANPTPDGGSVAAMAASLGGPSTRASPIR
jgi:D-3-phosphoglycerate dehydrogenase